MAAKEGLVSLDIATTKTVVALRKLRTNAPSIYAGAIYLFGAHVITKAMRYTPVDTGRLRNSRFVEKPALGATTGFSFAAGFGAYYAMAVHESNAKHAVGRRRFLAVAISEEAPKASRFVSAAVARLRESGTTIDMMPELHPTSPQIGPQERHDRFRTRRRGLDPVKGDKLMPARDSRRRGPLFGGAGP
jgi:hypothetical protein